MVFDSDALNKLMEDREEKYFLPVLVMDILSSVSLNVLSVYATGVAVKVAIMHCWAVDFTAICGYVNLLHNNLIQSARMVQLIQGFFPVCLLTV